MKWNKGVVWLELSGTMIEKVNHVYSYTLHLLAQKYVVVVVLANQKTLGNIL